MPECKWRWGGNRWLLVEPCPAESGKACNPPDFNGKFIDEPATTPCS